MISQLSKKESKFRKRFIAEMHYNKAEQKIFDENAKSKGGYAVVYAEVKRGRAYVFMTIIAMRKLSEEFKALSVPAEMVINDLTLLSEMLHVQKEIEQ